MKQIKIGIEPNSIDLMTLAQQKINDLNRLADEANNSGYTQAAKELQEAADVMTHFVAQMPVIYKNGLRRALEILGHEQPLSADWNLSGLRADLEFENDTVGMNTIDRVLLQIQQIEKEAE